jgi:protein tyrosine phosphatase (PTP) superfamily phosphohydrolase (DUF442 family)
MPIRTSLLALPALAGLLVGCAQPEQRNETKPVSPPIAVTNTTAYDLGTKVELPKVPPQDVHGLHNVYKLSDSIVSGSEPHGEEAFKELQSMGITTILSVDGKVPDQELASKYGMKYVHVPIQYKGITDEEMLKISKTFREQEGPFYVHCFHGKHRGPAAAEVGRIVLDGIPREQALAEMRQWCGTAQSYEGLYRVIAEANVPDVAATRSFAWDFPAAQPLGGFREGMIEVSRVDDNLKFLSKRTWEADPAHPDVDAFNEATKLASLLEQSAALDDIANKPPDFQGWMADSVKHSASLRDALHELRAGQGDGAQNAARADAAYKALSASCTACHETYRND